MENASANAKRTRSVLPFAIHSFQPESVTESSFEYPAHAFAVAVVGSRVHAGLRPRAPRPRHG